MKQYILFLLVLVLASCTKEKDVMYDVNQVNVANNKGSKTTVKSTTEFVSIAYSDLFNKTIPQNELLKLNTVYQAFGDKKFIEDRIIRNLLNDTNLVVPSQPSINSDTSLFIYKTYNTFFNRDPNAFESYYLKEQIRLNTNLKPIVIYYALMTSDEYRYY